jgi:hypothetical protein
VGCGGQVPTLRCWIKCVWCMVDVVYNWLSMIWDSLNVFISNLLRFAGFFIESLMVSKSAEICRFLCIWLAFSTLVSFSFNRCPPTFNSRSCFLDSDGPSTFDSSSEVSV